MTGKICILKAFERKIKKVVGKPKQMCYHIKSEVSEMEEERMDSMSEEVTEEQERYIPRPQWQVWGARVALVLFIVLVIMYYINIARGGL